MAVPGSKRYRCEDPDCEKANVGGKIFYVNPGERKRQWCANCSARRRHKVRTQIRENKQQKPPPRAYQPVTNPTPPQDDTQLHALIVRATSMDELNQHLERIEQRQEKIEQTLCALLKEWQSN